MPLLTIEHPQLDQSLKTYFEAPLALGNTGITSQNNGGFAANDFVVLGIPETERAEIKKVASVSGDKTVTLSAVTDFDHSADDPITQIAFDQIKLYRATSETGSYSLVATFDIQISTPGFSRYDDTAGTITSWYKIAFFNSQTAVEGELSDPIQAQGFKDRSVATMVKRVRRFADVMDKDAWPDEDIISELKEEQRRFNSKKWAFREATAPFGLTANDDSYDLAAIAANYGTLKALKDVNGSTVTWPKYLPPIRFFELKQNTSTKNNVPTAFTIWAGEILYLEIPSTTRASSQTLYHWKKLATLDSQNDVTDVPQPDVLVFGAAIRLAMMAGKQGRIRELRTSYAEAYALLEEEQKDKEGQGFMAVRRPGVQVWDEVDWTLRQNAPLIQL